MSAAASVFASGRFVSRSSFAVIFAVSILLLPPTPPEMSSAERVLVATLTATVFAAVWAGVSVIERLLRRRSGRITVIMTTLVLASALRPALQDGISAAMALPVPGSGAGFLRAVTNVVVWGVALTGTAVLVDATRTTRETNTLLRGVLAQLRTSAERARVFDREARFAVATTAATLRRPLDNAPASATERAAALRALAHQLAASAGDARSSAAGPRIVADAPRLVTPSPAPDIVTPVEAAPAGDPAGVAASAEETRGPAEAPPRNAPSLVRLFRLPPLGAVTAMYGLAVLPYAARTLGPTEVVVGLGATAVVGVLAEGAARARRWRRAARSRLMVFGIAMTVAGVVFSLVAAAQGVPGPAAVVPAVAVPAIAAALSRWRGGRHAVAVERRRLSAAITARTSADELGTRTQRSGLRAAAEIVHRDAQGALVQFALRHPDPSEAELAAMSAQLDAVAARVLQALDAPGAGRATVSLDTLMATWACAMPVDAHVSDDARAALDADPALAAEAIEIVAEGLLNAAKHAQPRSAAVVIRVLTAADGVARLRVSVRSPGIPEPDSTLRATSRAALLGARVVAHSDATELLIHFVLAAPFVVSTEHHVGGASAPS